jgi:hypothetical protein
MKKYSINRLIIEIGRWCNMTCRHCFKGERENMAIKPQYVEKLLENLSLVNILYFCGGESSLYINEMIEILEIFKKMNVPVNYIRVNSNILIKSEKFVNFLNNIDKYSTYSEVKLLISKDKFHLENMEKMGINVAKYEETKAWYREKLHDNIVFSENSETEWKLYLEGNARTLPKEELHNYLIKEANYTVLKNVFFDEKDIKSEDTKNILLKNCLVNIEISAEGYLFFSQFSYDRQRLNNYELSLGNVCDDTLENLIKKWNDNVVPLPATTQYEKTSQIGIYKYINGALAIKKQVSKAVYSNDDDKFFKLKRQFDKLCENYKHDLKFKQKYDCENDMLKWTDNTINTVKQMFDLLSDVPNGFVRRLEMRVIDYYGNKSNNEIE